MSKKDEPKNNGGIPEGTVNNVFEHTFGGFILFYFNTQTGEPEQVASFDSPAHAIALHKHISDWAKAVDKLSLNNSIFSIQQDILDSSIDENDEDEEI